MSPVAPRAGLSRRTLLRGSGALIVTFSLQPAGGVARAQGIDAHPTLQAPATAVATAVAEQQPVPSPAAAPNPRATGAVQANQVDSWLAVGQDGSVTIYSGRVELGTGVRTALAQIAADELYVPFQGITMVQGDTARTPDEGYTAGSKTIQVGGVALPKAAAEARQALLEMGSARLGVSPEALTIQNGAISAHGQTVTYGDLIGGQVFNRTVSDQTPLKDPSLYTIVGQPVAHLDLPGKITAQPSYVQDLRLPGMLHGRVIHPATIGASVASVDESSVSGISDLVKVVQNGHFVGLVAQSEWGAIHAARQLKVDWTPASTLPDQSQLADWLRQPGTSDKQPVTKGDVDDALASTATVVQATYAQPYQNHASIGPSCAVADVQGGRVALYSSTQGVYPLRGAVAQLLNVDQSAVHVMHMEGSGCYGHNGFDDAAGEAALLSQAVGQPVRVQWMREDEHVWEPHGPATVVDVRGVVDGQGQVSAWDYQVWTPTHSGQGQQPDHEDERQAVASPT